MKVTRFVVAAVLAGAFGASAVQAQNGDRQPAEFPPASYAGKQYVDSRGCVFIRAGIDGNVTWVPRVTRSREMMCGAEPTGITRVASGSTPPVALPVVITPEPTPTPGPSAAPRPAATGVAAPMAAPSRVVEVPRAAPAPTTSPRRSAAPSSAGQMAASSRKAPVAIPARSARATSVCPDASLQGQQVLRIGGHRAQRCNPQAASAHGVHHIASARTTLATRQSNEAKVIAQQARTAAPPAPMMVSPHTRIVPKHVAYNRINTRNVAVPKGYRRVWEDGRLNPYRAEQTLAGRSDMLLVWTQTVPRRLIDPRTGADMTASVPLVYPFLDVVTQTRELGRVKIVQQGGKRVKKVIRTPVKTVKPVYSSRSNAKQPVPTGKAQYVQVGSFGSPANAERAVQKIAAMGWSSRIAKQSRSGKTYLTVQAGPFEHASVPHALTRLKRAGYRDAFARR